MVILIVKAQPKSFNREKAPKIDKKHCGGVFGENENEKLHVDIQCVLIVTIGIQTG